MTDRREPFMRSDRHRDQRDQAEAVARHAAQQANGLFLRAYEVAGLRYQLQRREAGAAGADGALAGFVSSLLDQRGIGPIELRAAHPFERPLTSAEVDEHPLTRCAHCHGPSMESGDAYRECRRCGRGFLLVAPDDVAL